MSRYSIKISKLTNKMLDGQVIPENIWDDNKNRDNIKDLYCQGWKYVLKMIDLSR